MRPGLGPRSLTAASDPVDRSRRLGGRGAGASRPKTLKPDGEHVVLPVDLQEDVHESEANSAQVRRRLRAEIGRRQGAGGSPPLRILLSACSPPLPHGTEPVTGTRFAECVLETAFSGRVVLTEPVETVGGFRWREIVRASERESTARPKSTIPESATSERGLISIFIFVLPISTSGPVG